MKKIVLFASFLVLTALLSSCSLLPKTFKSVSVRTSSHVRNFANTETGLFNTMGVYIKLIGYDGTVFASLGPGSQVTEADDIWFQSVDVPVVAWIYKDNAYSQLIGVWGKTLKISSLRDMIYEITSFYTRDGLVSRGPKNLGNAHTSGIAYIPKPNWGNEFHVLFVGGSGDDIYLNIEGESLSFPFGYVSRGSYRVEKQGQYISRSIQFSYTVIRDGRLLSTHRGRFVPRGTTDGPGGMVIILGPNGPKYL